MSSMTTATVNYGALDPSSQLSQRENFESILLLGQRPLILAEAQQDVNPNDAGVRSDLSEIKLSPSSLVTTDESFQGDDKASPVMSTTPTAAVHSSSLPAVCEGKVKSSAGHHHRKKVAYLDKELFTFKPKLNRKSTQIAQNILGFYERQNRHCQKQMELVRVSELNRSPSRLA